MVEQRQKVCVIGLDGATFDLVKPWVEQGHLPHVGRLMAEGVHGKLRSTIHPLSAPAWTSFMTGKNPGKHGIFDFIERPDHRYTISYTSGRSRQAKTLWGLLSEAGKSVIVLNVPMTYPAEPVNGALVGGLDSPSVRSPFTYPPALYAEMTAAVGEYSITVRYDERRGRKRYVQDIFKMIENRAATADYLLRRYPWDFFIVVFSAPDIVQHSFWKYMDRDHPDHDPREAAEFGGVILEVYQRIDRWLGTLMARLDEDTTLVIMSDHGAGPFKQAISLNRWLEQHGFLHFRDAASPPAPWRATALRTERLNQVLAGLKRVTPVGVKVTLRRAFPRLRERVNARLLFAPIDWPRTKAFSVGVLGSIAINLAGREPQGIVSPSGEYEAVRDAIIEKLAELRHPETGAPLVERVYRREELYHGAWVDRAPDLLVVWKDYAYTAQYDYGEAGTGVFQARKTFEFSAKEHNGSHRPDGLLILKGRQVRSGHAVEGAEIIDLAPTILYAMGLPVPLDMDGNVLTAAFRRTALEANPVRYASPRGQQGGQAGVEGPYSAGEAEEIRKRLVDLGYLG